MSGECVCDSDVALQMWTSVVWRKWRFVTGMLSALMRSVDLIALVMTVSMETD